MEGGKSAPISLTRLSVCRHQLGGGGERPDWHTAKTEGWNAGGKSRLGCSLSDTFTRRCLLFRLAKGFNQEQLVLGHMLGVLVSV